MTREEAIELIRRNCIPGRQLYEACAMLIPELAESEDEIHRKWILEYLYDGLRKSDEQFKGQFKSAIDWLEKQKEQKHSLNFDTISSWLRDHASRYVNSEYNEFHHCTEYDGTINVERLIADLKVAVDSDIFDTHEQKEQKPVEWSEKDERIMGRIQMILEFFDRNYPADMSIGSEVPKYIAWLNSIRPQSHWKPSEEQMKQLKSAASLDEFGPFVTTRKQFPDLESLYEHLKKLI